MWADTWVPERQCRAATGDDGRRRATTGDDVGADPRVRPQRGATTDRRAPARRIRGDVRADARQRCFVTDDPLVSWEALALSIITIVISILAHNILALIVVLGLLIGGVMLWSKAQKRGTQPTAV